MEELQLTLTPARVDQRNSGIMFANWRVGQTLSALVVDRMPNGASLLSIGGQSFVSPSDIPVQPGNRIYLEVQKTDPQLVLRLIIKDAIPTPVVPNTVLGGNLTPASTVAGGSVAKLLSFMMSDPNLQKQMATSGLLGPLFSQLKGNAINGVRIDASILQKLFTLSGIFTESHWLARRDNEALKSTKSLLLAINGHIFKTPSNTAAGSLNQANARQLLSLIDTALSSIAQNQILSIPESSTNPKWYLTVPLEWRDEYREMEFEISRETGQPDEVEEVWKLRLSIELPELGALEVEVVLKGGRVNVQLMGNDTSVAQFERSSEYLSSQLIMAGLKIDGVSAMRAPTETARKSEIQENGFSAFV
ncbi:flagellar hook-length control protein FliK [Luminiphilus sp.]|nr:flagellar hook-length control protein FliK [Luminiphilus sp.]